MGKEAKLLKNNIKICLLPYKIAVSLCFVFGLAFARGISEVVEIGMTLDSGICLLVIVFCADVYQAEFREKRWEIFMLYPLKNQVKTIYQRLILQCCYLLLLSILGYGIFFWQQPGHFYEISQQQLFLEFLGAVAGSIFFWSVLSMSLTNMLANMWGGIGISIILWLSAISAGGNQVMGDFNVFAYMFRGVESNDHQWIIGKVIAILIAAVLILLVPLMIRRGNQDGIKY
jgi:hypothetical protein